MGKIYIYFVCFLAPKFIYKITTRIVKQVAVNKWNHKENTQMFKNSNRIVNNFCN